MLEHSVATEVGSLLQGVVRYGTGTRAQVAGIVIAGKTGTTEGYGDAWFVGWSPKYTVAVWVGYPNEFKSMETEYNGQPVAGGTYPGGDLPDVHEARRCGSTRPRTRRPTRRPRRPRRSPGATAAPTTPVRPRRPRPTRAARRPRAEQPAPPEAPTPVAHATPPATTPQPGGDEAPDATQP